MINLKDYRPLVAKWLPTGKTLEVLGVCVKTGWGLALQTSNGLMHLHASVEAIEGKVYHGVVAELLQHELSKDENGNWTKWVPSKENLRTIRIIEVW